MGQAKLLPAFAEQIAVQFPVAVRLAFEGAHYGVTGALLIFDDLPLRFEKFRKARFGALRTGFSFVRPALGSFKRHFKAILWR
jgi:hypothetical protein